MATYISAQNGHLVLISGTGYDETYEVVGTISAATPVSLPSSGTYDSANDLELYVNNIPQDSGYDWNTSGSAPYSAVIFTFDLLAGDKVRFRVAGV